MKDVLYLVAVLGLFAASVTADCGTQAGYSGRRKRVVSGAEVTDPYKWPWTGRVKLLFMGTSYNLCTAVLVNEWWVLTSAQCILFWDNPDFYSVVMGHGYSTAETFAVTEFKIHPLYDTLPQEYDACLLKLATPATDFEAACVVDDAFDYTTFGDCWLTGYGNVGLGVGLPYPGRIQEALMGHVTTATCQAAWAPNLMSISENHMCAGSPLPDHGAACHGDGGAPLNCEKDGIWSIGGITAFGTGTCGDVTGFPDVFTRASSVYSGFLENAVAGLTPESRTLECYHETEFTCKGPQCISALNRCDGNPYCVYEDDEAYCGDHVKYFNPTPDTTFSGVPGETTTVANEDECADRCLTSQGFVCHQFAFTVATGLCELRVEDYGTISSVSQTDTVLFRLQYFGGHGDTTESNILGAGQFSTPRYFSENTRRKLTAVTVTTDPGTNVQLSFDHLFDDPDQPACPTCKAELRVRLKDSTTYLLNECIQDISSLPASFEAPGNEVVVEWFTHRPEMTGMIGSFLAV